MQRKREGRRRRRERGGRGGRRGGKREGVTKQTRYIPVSSFFLMLPLGLPRGRLGTGAGNGLFFRFLPRFLPPSSNEGGCWDRTPSAAATLFVSPFSWLILFTIAASVLFLVASSE